MSTNPESPAPAAATVVYPWSELDMASIIAPENEKIERANLVLLGTKVEKETVLTTLSVVAFSTAISNMIEHLGNDRFAADGSGLIPIALELISKDALRVVLTFCKHRIDRLSEIKIAPMKDEIGSKLKELALDDQEKEALKKIGLADLMINVAQGANYLGAQIPLHFVSREVMTRILTNNPSDTKEKLKINEDWSPQEITGFCDKFEATHQDSPFVTAMKKATPEKNPK